MNEKLKLWLWLTEVFGAANPRKWEATARFSSIEECYYAYSHGDFYGLTEAEIAKVKKTRLDSAEKTAEYCSENNINIYCYESEGFPERLREIYNPPSVIYARHNGASLDFLDDSVSIAIVGARNLDEYYEKVTYEIAGQLALAGAVVISGFAVGADTAAHRAAIKNGGKTVAVLGSGIDYDYPKGTLDFKREIAENGAVISEFSPLHAPTPVDFKARNRLLSGLSLGILVTQASTKSGSLNTVSNGVSQGKDIFCIPPKDIFNENYRGVVQLIRDGATPVFDARDIVFEYFENYSHRLDYARNMMDFSQKSADNSVFSEKAPRPEKPRKNPSEKKAAEETEAVKLEAVPDGLSEIQSKIVSLLSGKKLLADEISRETGIDIMELFGELTELELMGIVKSLPGNRYTL